MNVPQWAKIIFIIFAALISAGCAAPEIDWTARMGNYTYDQAVKDFGPPDKYAKLADGAIVADWLTRRGIVIVQPEPFYPGPYGARGPLPPATYSELYAPNDYMQLTFAPNATLENYKDISR